jgi:hypothetical protein
MRTPSDKRSDKEIIDEIINQAGDRSVEPLVKRRVDDLRKLSSPFTGNRRDNADYLEDLSKLIVRLEKQLKTVPWPLSAALSKPELFNRLLMFQYTGIGINPQTRLMVQVQGPNRLTSFLAYLDWWRAQCEQLRDLGTNKRLDYRKLGAAIASCELLESIAGMTGKKLSLSCRRKSKFCEIAALFFEAMTGEYAADLRRQCENVRAKTIKNLHFARTTAAANRGTSEPSDADGGNRWRAKRIPKTSIR